MTYPAKLVVKLIEREDGSCVVYLRRGTQTKRRQRCADLAEALRVLSMEQEISADNAPVRTYSDAAEVQPLVSKDSSATPAAKIDTASAIQPRSSLAAFWRRLISMSIRKASPVRSLTPDSASAKSSFVMARKSLHVLWGFDDIDSFLKSIRKRHALCRSCWNHYAYPHDEMSDYGHLLAVDIPRLVALVEKLKKGPK